MSDYTVPGTDIDIQSLPKISLHDHLDGGLRPSTILELADSVGASVPEDPTTGKAIDSPERLGQWFADQADSGSLVSQLAMTGGGKLVAFYCVDGNEEVLMPCGRCRQLLYEHSAPGMVLETLSGHKTIDEVLPDAFGPGQLEEYRS